MKEKNTEKLQKFLMPYPADEMSSGAKIWIVTEVDRSDDDFASE